jgi:hypothetical protein
MEEHDQDQSRSGHPRVNRTADPRGDDRYELWQRERARLGLEILRALEFGRVRGFHGWTMHQVIEAWVNRPDSEVK